MEPRTNFLEATASVCAEDQSTGAGVPDDFRDDIGNESVAHGGNAVDPLAANVAGEAVEHQPRIAVHAEGIVIGKRRRFRPASTREAIPRERG